MSCRGPRDRCFLLFSVSFFSSSSGFFNIRSFQLKSAWKHHEKAWKHHHRLTGFLLRAKEDLSAF
jgi:hypothetical protein